MKGRKQSYAYFKDTALFSHESMSYVEQGFEALIDGKEESLAPWLRDFLEVPTKHHAICQALFNQAAMPKAAMPKAEQQSAYALIGHYREYGHLAVDLGLVEDRRVPVDFSEPSGVLVHQFGDRYFEQSADWWVKTLREYFMQDIAFEYSYLPKEEQQWFDVKLQEGVKLSQAERLKAYEDLYRAEALERYLGIQFVGQKRFSLEGAEAFIPLVEQVISTHVLKGYDDVVMGMAHRGRLNTLVNVLGLSVQELMNEFQGKHRISDTSGDVKYHLGHSVNREFENQPYHIALAYNPSHLEAINCVVMGNVRARLDKQQSSPFGIIVHGDAAIAGQGVVMEGLMMSQVKAYHIGGVVHIVINNQIGFTTNPEDARSSPYCTDIAKMIASPVMHVRCDDIDSVIKVGKLASLYRHQFKKDVFIDLIGYRKYGHNEADEPRATQPLMYQQLKGKGAVSSCYRMSLLQSGITEQQLKEIEDRIKQRIEKQDRLISTLAQTQSSRHAAWLEVSQKPWDSAYQLPISEARLKEQALVLLSLPPQAVLQKQVQKVHESRLLMAEGKQPLNWGMAELLAYQLLLSDGHAVRLVGQDAIRGTFSHRHASLFDQDSGERYVLPKSIHAKFENYNSILSEYGCLGFEYGYSETAPQSLVVFEAQFGDFINGAQIIIDQFIVSAYQKWKRYSGLVLLLPHGYEGQGPEHSSARLERFLQLCAQDNIQVCVPTTPKQIFHLLLRQIYRSHRTPLVVMSPKSLLRHPKAISSLSELVDKSFEACMNDERYQATDLVLCSGKIYYDLETYREKEGIENKSLIRIEQLYPFPKQELKKIMAQYQDIQSVTWCQEEPKNQGAWHFVRDYLASVFENVTVRCVARAEAASPAVGYMGEHQKQLAAILENVLKGEKDES